MTAFEIDWILDIYCPIKDEHYSLIFIFATQPEIIPGKWILSMRKLVKITIALVILFFLNNAYTGIPLWTVIPDPNYPTSLYLTPMGKANVVYTVTNKSHKTHTLAMQPIRGVTQITSGDNCSSVFTLAYQKSCTLSLSINGNLLTGDIHGGPVVCEQGGTFECYQPSFPNILNIIFIPIARYLITPIAGVNGAINPDNPQTVLAGSSLTFTARPNSGYQVDQWLVDGGIAQKGGSTFTLAQIDTNHTVEATFTRSGTIFVGTAGGEVYFSINNGLNWNTTTTPSPGFSVNSVFATPTTLYAGSADGKVYYSTNNGVTWNATAAVPGGTEVNSVFITSIGNVLTIYTGTQDGHVYYSIDGITWNATTNPGAGAVNSLFITPANTLYAGSNDGNAYYSTDNGTNWIQIIGPESNLAVPIQNIFAVNNQLYVNIRKISSNSTLPAGTVDFEYTYTSNSLTNTNPTWNLLSQITYTLFVNADASAIYAGTQDGYIFSLTTGDELGFITYSPISSLFFIS
ncbi:NHL repeat protein [Legionella feeleii]|uniref:NHL repeat protein n=2 Tax=Legionella feeleii TaxID=453 RepID=A0A0W0U4Z2_9GAMM|nr:NHL repeat protein [Legionella feeleii]SPX59924.1 NHL repeat protein [Legionella feeleii]